MNYDQIYNLENLLKKYSEKSTVNPNFFSKTSNNVTNQYFINDIENFYNDLDKLYLHNKNELNKNSLLQIQKHKEYSYLRFDIDIEPTCDNLDKTKTFIDKNFPLYNSEFIRKLVLILYEILNENFKKLSVKQSHMGIFKKEKWINRDGLHIFFPHLFIYNNFQDEVLTPQLQKKIGILNMTLENESKIKVDKIAKKPMVVYGFRKNSDEDQVYTLFTVYKSYEDINLKEINGEECDIQSELQSKHFQLYDKPSMWNIDKVKTDDILGLLTTKHTLEIDSSDVENAYKFLIEADVIDNLAYDRVYDYDKWIDIGSKLYSISNGDHRFFELWKIFSKRSFDKYDENVCIEKWKTFYSSGKVTIGTFKYYMSIDNPDAYKNYIKTKCVNSINREINTKNLDISHFSLHNGTCAELFNNIYGNRFYYDTFVDSGGGKGKWYKYNYNFHKWCFSGSEEIQSVLGGDEILSYFVDAFETYKLNEIDKYNSIIENAELPKITECVLANKKKHLSKCAIRFNKASALLKTTTFLEKSEAYCRINYKSIPFKANPENNILCCNNIHINLSETEKIKRFNIPTPDYRNTISTNSDYIEEPNHDNMQDLIIFLERLFPNKGIRNDTMRLLGLCLDGTQPEKLIIIATGVTGSGKSTFVTLLNKALGKDYCVTVPKETIYQRSLSPNVARPELVQTEHSRFVFILETSGTEKIAADFVKQISGKDQIFFRQLYKSGKSIQVPFVLFIACNFIPIIRQEDDALWERIVLINFESQFLTADKVPETEEEQKEKRKFVKMGPEADKWINNMAPSMLNLLVEYNATNKIKYKYNKGIPPLTHLRNATQRYRDTQNFIAKFIKDKLELVKSKESRTDIKIDDIYIYYKVWCKEFFSNNKEAISNLDHFKNEIIRQAPSSFILKTNKYSVYFENVRIKPTLIME